MAARNGSVQISEVRSDTAIIDDGKTVGSDTRTIRASRFRGPFLLHDPLNNLGAKGKVRSLCFMNVSSTLTSMCVLSCSAF